MTERGTDLDTTDVAGGGRAVTVTDLLRIPARRWKVPVVGALLGLLAGVGYLLMPVSYGATAAVAVRPVVTDPFSYPGPGADRVVNMTVENALATGTEVIGAVATATGQDATAARAGLTVELPVGSQVLRFRYAAPSSQDAVAGANAAASAYLQLRRGTYQRQRDAMVTSYDESIAKVGAEREKVRKDLPKKSPDEAGTSPSVTAQLDRLRALDDQLGELTARRAETAAVDVTPGTVTRVAAPPVASSRDSAPLYVVVALLGGALAGAVAAFGLEAVDRRVRSAAEASAVSRLQLLGELRGRRLLRGRSHRPTDLRHVALAVLGQLGPLPHRRIVLLNAGRGELPATVATGLALALAELGSVVRWEDLTGDAPASRSRMLAAAARPGPDGARPAAPVRRGPAPVLVEERETDRVTATATVTRSVRIGAGQVWLEAPTPPDETMITVVWAGPSEGDDRGVRAALEAAAVVLVRRDATRVADLARLAGTLRLTGAGSLGVVLVSGHD